MVHEIYTASVSDGRISKPAPYIYCVFCTDPRAVYIGQTGNLYGALGRLSQHLSDQSGNTLKQRLIDTFKYYDVDPVGIEFFAMRLAPHDVFFQSREFREAVEHLIQKDAIQFCVDQDLSLPVISRTQSNGYVKHPPLIAEAQRLSPMLHGWLSSKRKPRKLIG